MGILTEIVKRTPQQRKAGKMAARARKHITGQPSGNARDRRRERRKGLQKATEEHAG